MNASAQFTTTTPDTALLTRWATGNPTGDAWTLGDIDRLIALTPANDARALAELDDCRAIEVELLGYDPTAIPVTPLDCRGDMCPACNGSGEGMRDGTVCSACGGSGEVGPWPLWDDAGDLDDAALDAYLVGAYESAVA